MKGWAAQQFKAFFKAGFKADQVRNTQRPLPNPLYAANDAAHVHDRVQPGHGALARARVKLILRPHTNCTTAILFVMRCTCVDQLATFALADEPGWYLPAESPEHYMNQSCKVASCGTAPQKARKSRAVT